MTKLEAWISKFLFSEDNSEKGLRNPQKVYDFLNIQPRGKIILISGTNGKGTTGEILTQLGLQKGLKVGTFSSPHLIRINERIKINGEPISDKLFLKSLESVKAAKGDIPLNFFQYLALAMMKIFNDENIDLWIIEIGIGGRLDPTNILNADFDKLDQDNFFINSLSGEFFADSAGYANISNLNLNFDVGDAEIVGTISSELESFDTFDLEMSFNSKLSQNIPWYVAILGGFPAAAGAVVVTGVLEDGINQITETKYGISGSADNLIVETRQ